ncbi:O110 family O-antigen flippase [Escherichia coli]|nr:O110 family O-antigen flippase [Escherichia coli]
MNNFITNILKLISGTAGGQLIALLLMPIVTRLVTVDEMGKYSLVLAIIMVLSSVASMKLELAVMTLSSKTLVIHTLSAFCNVNFIIGILVLITGILLHFSIEHFPLTAVDVVLTALALYFFSLAQFVSSYYSALDEFKKSAINRFAKPVLAVVFQIVLVNLGFGENGLLLGFVIGYILSCFIFDSKFILMTMCHIDFRFVKESYKQFKSYFIFQAPAGVINSLSQNVANFMLIGMIGAYSLGIYSLSFRMLQAPISLISVSVRDAYFSRAKSIYEKEPSKLANDMLYVIITLTILSGLVSAIIFSYLPFIFAQLFGNSWRESGVVASYLLPWFVLLFSNPPASVVANIINMQRFIFIFEIANLIVRVLTLTFSWWFYKDFKLLIVHFSFAGVIMNLLYILMVYKMAIEKCKVQHAK